METSNNISSVVSTTDSKKRSKLRKLRKENEKLKTLVALLSAFSVVMTVFVLVLGAMFMINNNSLIVLKSEYTDLSNRFNVMNMNYRWMEDNYDEFARTAYNSRIISEQLQLENESLVNDNNEMKSDLIKYEQREELFDKYEYAVMDKYENRTDITYDQLITLEELVQEYPINDVDLILSMIMAESRGIETAQNSESTAKGYGQLLDSTAKYCYDELLNYDDITMIGYTYDMALDGDLNIEMMVAYINYLYESNGCSVEAAINSYRGCNDSSYKYTINSYLSNNNKNINTINTLAKVN